MAASTCASLPAASSASRLAHGHAGGHLGLAMAVISAAIAPPPTTHAAGLAHPLDGRRGQFNALRVGVVRRLWRHLHKAR